MIFKVVQTTTTAAHHARAVESVALQLRALQFLAVALRLQAERGYAYVCNREMHNKVCPLRIRAESDSWAAVQHHVSDCLNATSVSAAGGE